MGVASESGWNLWVWLVGVVVRRSYYLSLLLLYLFLFAAASLLFVHLKKSYIQYDMYALVAQLVERLHRKQYVVGSNPT